MVRAHRMAFALVLSLLAGCGGPEKELPKDITTPTDRGPEETGVAVPAASQPEAVKFVQTCIAAATESHPERLEKLKGNQVVEKGQQLHGMSQVAVTRLISAVWPDRFLFADETNTDGLVKISIGLNKNSLSFRKNGQSFDPGLPKGYEQVLLVDSVGQYWMQTLVPLADSKTILFGVRKQTVAGQTWDTVQAAVPGCPVITLWFNEKTHLLGVITYLHTEGISKLNKRLAVGEHKAFAGVLLPTRSEFERNGIVVETWAISSWDFPEKIEDAVFDQSK